MAIGFLSSPVVKLEAQVENEAVALVEVIGLWLLGEDSWVALALDVQKSWLKLLRLDVLESAIDTSM